VRAELTISHEPGDLLRDITGALGPHEPDALLSSNFFQKAPEAAVQLQYAKQGLSSLILAWATPGRLVIYVEPSGGRLRDEASSVWEIVRDSGSKLNPRLKLLSLFDEDANDQIATAGVGTAAQIKRPELAVALIAGAATLIWLAFALLLFKAGGDLVLGAIPSLVGALVAGVVLRIDAQSQKLVWQ
jgi:hypothetical protein